MLTEAAKSNKDKIQADLVFKPLLQAFGNKLNWMDNGYLVVTACTDMYRAAYITADNASNGIGYLVE